MVAEAGHQPWVTLGQVGLLSWRLQGAWRGLPLGGLMLRVSSCRILGRGRWREEACEPTEGRNPHPPVQQAGLALHFVISC